MYLQFEVDFYGRLIAKYTSPLDSMGTVSDVSDILRVNVTPDKVQGKTRRASHALDLF